MYRLCLIIAMLIWGSIGVFVKNINMSSIELAFFRALIGGSFLILFGVLFKKLSLKKYNKKVIFLLMCSGIAVSVNWILLFQAYKYTTVSMATLTYYFAPVLVILFSPIILKEKITATKLICILVAMVGLGILLNPSVLASKQGYENWVGIGFGLAAAVVYASIMFINKFIHNVSGIDSTVIQMTTAAIVLFIYIFGQKGFQLEEITAGAWGLVISLGIVHTGIAYLLFFTAIPKLSSQSAAVMSYIDPISAMIFAHLFLNESMTGWQTFGAILVLGSMIICEWLSKKIAVRVRR